MHLVQIKHFLASLFLIFSTLLSVQTIGQPTIDQQRETFVDAWNTAERGDLERARELAMQIPEYPLTPWIEYRVLMKKLYAFPVAEVDTFLAEQQGYWVGQKLLNFWVAALKQRDRYQTFIAYYVPNSGSTEQDCYYYDSQRRAGNLGIAWQGAGKLWLSARSQPKECDPLFAAWRKSDGYDPALTWERYLLANAAGQNSLAGYLQRSVLEEPYLSYAETASRVQQQPNLLRDTSITKSLPQNESVIASGLLKLIPQNPDLASQLLQSYADEGAIDQSDRSSLIARLSSTYARQGNLQAALAVAQQHADAVTESHLAAEVRRILPEQDWSMILDWIDLLPADEAANPRWRYWEARAQEQLGLPYQETMVELATARTFYGFLASMKLDQSFSLENQPEPVEPALHERLESDTKLVRALELRAVEFSLDARRGWFFDSNDRPNEEWNAAAKIAEAHDWHFMAISSMIRGGYWNDLETRFPLAYISDIQDAATKADISTTWAIAIARQESSFAEDIRSSAGAIGLMQLMPATAREMANANGVSYSAERLDEPSYNTLLGTSYLKRAYDQLYDNEVYASAGYNAGISRARSWLQDGRENLPLDIWIETIPFLETRGYVQNVMAFSAIYAEKLNVEHPMRRLGDQFYE